MEKQDLQISRQAATLRVLVEEKLRMAIANGRFQPGQRLIERELCELTGVGRTSIREALRQLEAEGLITTQPHRGPIVTVVTLEEAEQLYKVRALLEGFIGREFAQRAKPDDLANLKQALEGFEAAAKTGDRELLAVAKTRFYDCLIAGADNVFVRQMLTQLHNRVSQLRIISMTQPGRLERSLAEVRTIYDCIAAGDAEAAEAACIKHVEAASVTALAYLRQTAKAQTDKAQMDKAQTDKTKG